MDLHQALSLQATHVPRVLPPVLGIRALLPRRLICHREAHGTYHDGVNAEDLTDLRRLGLVEQARLCEPLLLQDLRQPASLDERKHVRERSLLQGLSLLRVLDGAKQARRADVLDPALLLKQLRSENVGEGTAIRPLAGEVQNSDLSHAGKDLLWWDEDEDARLLVHDGRRSSDQNSTCQQRDYLDGQHTTPPGWAPRRSLRLHHRHDHWFADAGLCQSNEGRRGRIESTLGVLDLMDDEGIGELAQDHLDNARVGQSVRRISPGSASPIRPSGGGAPVLP